MIEICLCAFVNEVDPDQMVQHKLLIRVCVFNEYYRPDSSLFYGSKVIHEVKGFKPETASVNNVK